MSIRSKIQALITAANAKTGESDTTLTDAVQTLVDGYGQGGGGGSLPQYITKISSGSFTFANRTILSTHIPHDLGITPVFLLCWTDELELNDSGNGLITGYLAAQSHYRNETQLYEAYRSALIRYSATELENIPSSVTNLSSVLGADYFCFYHGGRAYAAGVTYKWIAIA